MSKFDPSQSIASTSIAEEAFEVDDDDSQSSSNSAASVASSFSTSTESTQTIIHVASDYCPLGGVGIDSTLTTTVQYSDIEVQEEGEGGGGSDRGLYGGLDAVGDSNESTFLPSKPPEINFARKRREHGFGDHP